MRLIDADVFKTEYENLITWVSHRAEKERLREFIKDIQNQPTVEAIPIEWIMKKLIEADNTGMDIEDWSMKDCYALVLDEWEKENEQEASD